MRYSYKQLSNGLVACLAIFFSATLWSLQGPFYPNEAAKKGVTPSQFGFVFGFYEVVGFVSNIIVGRYAANFGMKLSAILSTFVAAISTVAFGFLNEVSDASVFLILSFLIRSFEALGQSGLNTCLIPILSTDFSSNVALILAVSEAFYGAGTALGPSIGGMLYDSGGFSLPFICVGAMLGIFATLMCFTVPKDAVTNKETSEKPSLYRLLKIKQIWIGMLANITGFICIGYLNATVEPHVRLLNLSGTQIGLIFFSQAVVYTITSPIFGWILDRGLDAVLVILLGDVTLALAFLVFGSAFGASVFLQMHIGMVLVGIGTAALFLTSLVHMRNSCRDNGVPDNMSSQSLISGFWMSGFSLGGFIGPSIGGILYDTIGFYNGCWVVITLIGFHTVLLIPDTFNMVKRKVNQNKRFHQDKTPLLSHISSIPNNIFT